MYLFLLLVLLLLSYSLFIKNGTNPKWLEEEAFAKLLSDGWIKYDVSSEISPSCWFVNNLKMAKDLSIKWSIEKKERDDRNIKMIEQKIQEKFHERGFNFFSTVSKQEILDLESKRW